MLSLLPSDLLQLRRFRLIPDAIDVIFVSLLLYNTGGQSSPWFLIYFFPIISGSRYLGLKGSVFLGVLTITLYIALILSLQGAQPIDPFSLILKIISVGLTSLIIGELAKERIKNEEDFISSEKRMGGGGSA